MPVLLLGTQVIMNMEKQHSIALNNTVLVVIFAFVTNNFEGKKSCNIFSAKVSKNEDELWSTEDRKTVPGRMIFKRVIKSPVQASKFLKSDCKKNAFCYFPIPLQTRAIVVTLTIISAMTWTI